MNFFETDIENLRARLESTQAATAPCEVAIIPDCDHFYNGREQTVVKAVTAWLARTLGLPRP